MQPIDLLLIFQSVDLLLDELENRKENGVDNAGSSHGNAQPPVQFLIEELNLRGLFDLLTLAYRQTISLIDTFRRINGINQGPACNTTQTTRKQH